MVPSTISQTGTLLAARVPALSRRGWRPVQRDVHLADGDRATLVQPETAQVVQHRVGTGVQKIELDRVTVGELCRAAEQHQVAHAGMRGQPGPAGARSARPG